MICDEKWVLFHLYHLSWFSFSFLIQYHGGTNFGRTSGGFVATSYDYDAPIDEYGRYAWLASRVGCSEVVYLYGWIGILSFNIWVFPLTPGLLNEPKWGHLRDLHKAIKLCEPALVSVDPTVKSLGKNQEVLF